LVNTIKKQEINELLIDVSEMFNDQFRNSEWATPVNEEWRRTNLSRYNLDAFKQIPLVLVQNKDNHPELPENDYSIYIRKEAGSEAEISINEQGAEGIVIFDILQSAEIGPGTQCAVLESVKFAGQHLSDKTEYLSFFTGQINFRFCFNEFSPSI